MLTSLILVSAANHEVYTLVYILNDWDVMAAFQEEEMICKLLHKQHHFVVRGVRLCQLCNAKLLEFLVKRA